MAQYSFISDISKPKDRAMRMGILHICMTIAKVVATPAGAAILEAGLLTLFN